MEGASFPSVWPERIICLTAETTEIAFALGAGARIVGVSGYAVRPPEARDKEKVAAFTSIRLDKIRALRPDLILGFSDLQKDIARELIQEGFNVFITNQRSLRETGDAILAIGRLMGLAAEGEKLARSFFSEIESLRLPRTDAPRPRVYFEEWDEPLVTGIRWVSELIEALGGEDIFADKSRGVLARERTVTPEEVLAGRPDVIFASWCGKKVRPEKICSRPGWETLEAVRANRIYEIKSPDILAPGLSLLHGARCMADILRETCAAAAGSGGGKS